ncbi:hypothetical protein [Candidatus Entotheonella palauensis]|uniref:hypothetical protein n=1 Tax=Candidatus Entotheonella palauensis TaxID=93172 RepID=UPI0021183BAE|nr:hypothetical protein [Candidatus Entotheonella palauensis]
MGGRRLRYGMMLAGLILAMHGQLGQTAAQGNPCASRDMADIPQEAVKAAVHEVIDQNKQANDGKFIFKDNRTGRDLELEFEDFRVVRGVHGHGFFPNVIFRAAGMPEKKYALDFWFKPKGNGLELMDIRIQKGPKKRAGKWRMVTRMPVAWWWLPASEHPGEFEELRAWEVMSAIHAHIANERRQNHGLFKLKDSKTGEEIALEFVEMHQPVRRLKGDGRYFACSDFRRQGSQTEYYDIDFWLNEEDGSVKVGDVRVHKVPVQEDGVWVQIPRYNFDNLDYDKVN